MHGYGSYFRNFSRHHEDRAEGRTPTPSFSSTPLWTSSFSPSLSKSTPSLSVVTPPPPLPGSGFSDLRTVVGAQQRQIDGLFDKVAALVSAKHAEIVEDVRKERGDTKGDVAHLVDLRESEGGLRAWMQRCLQDGLQAQQDQVETKLHYLKERFTGEVRDAHETLSYEVRGIRLQLSRLKDSSFCADADDAADELRRDVDARMERGMAQMQNSMGVLAGNLRRDFEAQVRASMEMSVSAASLPQEHAAVPSDTHTELKEGLRKENEARLEARMNQTFGMAQRLMNELRKDLEGQVVQLHDAMQRMAHELCRNVEVQEVRVQSSVQEFVQEEIRRAIADAVPSVESSRQRHVAASATGEAEENLQGCRAFVEVSLAECERAAVECARLVGEASTKADAVEARLSSVVEDLGDRVAEEARRLGEVSACTNAMDAELRSIISELDAQVSAEASCVKEASEKADAMELRLRSVAEEVRCRPSEASATTNAVEAQLRSSVDELGERVAEEARRVSETTAKTSAMEAELRSLVDEFGARATEGASSVQESSAKSDAVEARLRSVADEKLADCKAAAAECARLVSETSAKSEAMDARLRSIVDEVGARAAEGVSGAQEPPMKSEAIEMQLRSVAEENLADCKAAAAECASFVSETSARADAMARHLRSEAEELRVQLQADVRGAGVDSTRTATSAPPNVTEGDASDLPPAQAIVDLAGRIDKLEGLVARMQQLLLALRDHVIPEDSPRGESDDDAEYGPGDGQYSPHNASFSEQSEQEL